MSNHKDLSEKTISNLLTLPNEKLIVAKRQHELVLLVPILLTTFLTLVSIVSLTSLFALEILDSFLFITLIGLALWLTFAMVVKILVEWNYHIYIVTTRKVLEIRCLPFYTDKIDDVFLDQVRTTEVDIKISNFLKELFDMGDVILAFDRPSHEEVFCLKDIKNPREVGLMLANSLESLMTKGPSVWFKHGKMVEHIKVAEEVYPKADESGR